MSKFHSLTVTDINNLTSDAVEINFDISKTNDFDFLPGQYITLKHEIDGEEVRRAYSICSAPSEGLSIGVKRVEGGKMSTFLVDHLNIGDSLEVMPPSGNFVYKENKKHVVAICAGSGITPIFSMIKSIDDHTNFSLLYGNKSEQSTMFYSELKTIKDNSSKHLNIHWFFSKEKVQSSINGRIDKNNLQQLLNTFSDLKDADDFYICGPGDLIDNVKELLLLNQINESKIHFERFTAAEKENNETDSEADIMSNVTVCVDGDDFEFTLSSKGQYILDAAMEHGADVPYSCKGAVCCTCKGKVMEGKVTMDANYSLSEDEVAQGYFLGCTSRPASPNLVVDFDEI
tara:strand:+ start:2594 stop:3625 length:1032 start_codon:yes stop_codon:yes gene_type:complete